MVPPTSVSYPKSLLTQQLINYDWCWEFRINPIPEAQMSVTGDTANRLGFTLQSLVHFTRKNRSLPYALALPGVWRQDERNMVFRRVPLGHCRCPSISYRSSTSAGTVRPESHLGSTKPEPIVTCGCTGKLPVKVYPSVSSWLGEAFCKMSWRFSMHPWVNHWVLQGALPSVLHPVVNWSPSWDLEVLGL
jgi:hypothetical protein